MEDAKAAATSADKPLMDAPPAASSAPNVVPSSSATSSTLSNDLPAGAILAGPALDSPAKDIKQSRFISIATRQAQGVCAVHGCHKSTSGTFGRCDQHNAVLKSVKTCLDNLSLSLHSTGGSAYITRLHKVVDGMRGLMSGSNAHAQDSEMPEEVDVYRFDVRPKQNHQRDLEDKELEQAKAKLLGKAKSRRTTSISSTSTTSDPTAIVTSSTMPTSSSPGVLSSDGHSMSPPPEPQAGAYTHRASLSDMPLGSFRLTSRGMDVAEDDSLPIIDIRVVQTGKEKVPAGYHILKRTVDNHKADLNRGNGGRDVFLCYRRARQLGVEETDEKGTVLRPITALSVQFVDTDEEAPYGFSLVPHTVSGKFVADLNAGASGRRILLALKRGNGPPITDLAVVLQERKETVPDGFHEIVHTPVGNKANLNSGTDGARISLCFRLQTSAALEQFRTASLDPSEQVLHRTLACIVCALYSGNQGLVSDALQCFKVLRGVPSELVNRFVMAACTSVDTFLTYFTTQAHSSFLQWLNAVYTMHISTLQVPVVMNMLTVCMILRHEDKRDRVSRQMLEYTIKNVPECHDVDCECWYESGRKKKKNSLLKGVPPPPKGTPPTNQRKDEPSAAAAAVAEALARHTEEISIKAPPSPMPAPDDHRSLHKDEDTNSSSVRSSLLTLNVGHTSSESTVDDVDTPVAAPTGRTIPAFATRTPEDVPEDVPEEEDDEKEKEPEASDEVDDTPKTARREASPSKLPVADSLASITTDESGDAPVVAPTELDTPSLDFDTDALLFVTGGYDAAQQEDEKTTEDDNPPAEDSAQDTAVAKEDKAPEQADDQQPSAPTADTDAVDTAVEQATGDAVQESSAPTEPAQGDDDEQKTGDSGDSGAQEQRSGTPTPTEDVEEDAGSSKSTPQRSAPVHDEQGSSTDDDDDDGDDAHTTPQKSALKTPVSDSGGKGQPLPLADAVEEEKEEEEKGQERGVKFVDNDDEEEEEEEEKTPDKATRALRARTMERAQIMMPSSSSSSSSAAAEERMARERQVTLPARCQKCCQRWVMKKASKFDYCMHLVRAMQGNVVLAKQTETSVNTFLRHSLITPSFIDDVTKFVTQWFPHHNTSVYVAMLMMFAKFGAESAPFGGGHSERLKRKAHGLVLVLHGLKYSGDFFTGGGVGFAPGLPITVTQVVLRRIICTSFIDACVTDVSSIFRLLTQQLFHLLWKKFRDQLMIELGVIMDTLFMGLLESAVSFPAQKKDIIDALMHIFNERGAVIYIFYNYDNDRRAWKIYERAVMAVTNVIETDLVKPTGTGSGASLKDPGRDPLRRRALRLLVNILYMLAQWIGVPGLRPLPSKAGDSVVKPLAVETVDEKSLMKTAEESGVASSGPLRVVHQHQKEHRLRRQQSTRSTWRDRFKAQKEEAKVIQQAVKLSQLESLKSALKYLKMATTHNQRFPNFIAQFLFDENENLSPREVGDILGNDRDSLMTAQEYTKLRECYLNLLDFTGLQFDEALRMYLCHSGFRLPGEGQKVDRLLTVFARTYCRDNPGVFKSASAASVLSYAVVMLNTELNNPNLKNKRMTLDEFIRNTRGTNDGEDFPASFLTDLYNGIKESPIEWQSDIVQDEDDSNDEEKDLGKAYREYALLARKAHAALKNEAPHQRNFQRTSSVHIVKALFEVSWFQFVAAIQTLIDHTKDVEVIQVCLDGISFGASTAIMLGLETERRAFIRVLARITYVEHRRDEKHGDLYRKLVGGKHLDQDWVSPLNIEAELHPVSACHHIQQLVHDTKEHIRQERHQRELKDLEVKFGGEIHLVDPQRVLIKSDIITKISSTNKKVDYRFFLFNDLLLYGSESGGAGANARYKFHRVIHLSLIRLEDTVEESVAPFAFKVVSPQKSITISFNSKKAKKEWFSLLYETTRKVREARTMYLKSGGSNKTGIDSDDEDAAADVAEHDDDDVMRRFSTFIGYTGGDLKSFQEQYSRQKLFCKLCIRPYAVFRRRNTCNYCQDMVCGECCSRRVLIPGSGNAKQQYVCDACYGVLKGMVGAKVPLSTNRQAKLKADRLSRRRVASAMM